MSDLGIAIITMIDQVKLFYGYILTVNTEHCVFWNKAQFHISVKYSRIKFEKAGKLQKINVQSEHQLFYT